MLWVPQKGIVRVDHNMGTIASATPGTSVTTGAGASTKGTPAQLIASTAFDAYWVRVIAMNYGSNAVSSAGCLDILIGAATEEVLIPNLLMGFCGTVAGQGRGPKVWDFPLYVPGGSRIAAQCAGERTTTAMRVGIFLYGGNGYPPFRVGSKVTTYGIGTVPDGVSIAAGNAAEGSWTEITSGTSEDHFALVPSFQCSADSSLITRAVAVDLGVGAATEEEIAAQYGYGTDIGEAMDGPFNSMPFFGDIPSGSRLVMRASNSGTTDTTNGAIHGVS